MTDSRESLSGTYDNAIDLRELFRVLWNGKWLIVGITLTAAVIAVIVTLIIPNIYRAEALLAPKDQDGGTLLSSAASQYSDLASLVGINLSKGSTDKTALGLEVLKSRKFVSEFVERHDILVPLMGVRGWDADSGELEIDADLYDTVAKRWVRKVRPPKKTIPSMQEAYEEFMDILSVSQDKKSAFIKIGIDHYAPTVAKQWVDWLVEDINSTIMQQDVAEAQQAIEYLNEQIQSTSLADLQNVFFKLIEEQTKTVMLAKASDEYLFETIDPAVVPEKHARPNRLLIVVLATLLGGMLGVAFVGILSRIRQ